MKYTFTLLSLLMLHPTVLKGHESEPKLDFISSRKAHPNASRIVGGVVTTSGQWPFTAALFLLYPYWDILGAIARGFSYSQFICGAVIWNGNTIVTAAHCVVDPLGDGNGINILPHTRMLVYLGDYDLNSVTPENRFPLSRIHVHKGYNIHSKANDIAILKLAGSINFDGANIKCVCEPEALSSISPKNCIALGWGRTGEGEYWTPKLRQVGLHAFTPEECAPLGVNTKLQICAGIMAGGKDTCNGDSGGPLVCPLTSNSNVYSLIGLTSYGNRNCGAPDSPAVYTSVHAYVNWIEKHAE